MEKEQLKVSRDLSSQATPAAVAEAATACGNLEEDQTTNQSDVREARKQVSIGASIVQSSTTGGENKYRRQRKDRSPRPEDNPTI